MNRIRAWFLGPAGVYQVLRLALPLIISTGTLSLVLFIDRTLLLRYEGAAMSAAMAAGNLYWTLVCLPFGLVSMTGAFVAQYVGSNQRHQVGKLLWQSIWFALATVPLFIALAIFTPWFFEVTGQPPELLRLETIYMRILLIGAVGSVIEMALSGFFSGIEKTQTVMWVSILSAILNIVLDVVLIFGWGPVPEMGIVGAGIASAISFWFKAILFAGLIWFQADDKIYAFRSGCVLDLPRLGRLLYYGLPAGLQFVVEGGGFTLIVLKIGALGDISLRATTMAVNFNMIAFIPLIGLSVATSVLVGRHLTESGPALAQRAVASALSIAVLYSATWASCYLLFPDQLLLLYRLLEMDSDSEAAIKLARGLLGFVAMYVLFDAIQLILAGALRGAGDTWFVLVGTGICSLSAILLGSYFQPESGLLNWWWWVITGWVWMLAMVMILRFLQGRWRSMDMVGKNDPIPPVEL
ncbi:Multidrug resistance protein MdtK [Roseimaritima multifibrata]|uniref:Multidrug-efflux transporter n=1 Tax=Roseimaritima multifibrata TaxID=1930274 RepID=A0A517MF86_9BACT|nr:MATE family efflux transporter [Roseimaritima multifibrata]QDS93550.1 Multidrug resistance protein MdtK [Roseimaritima multifibrata]